MRIKFWGTRGSLPIALTAEDLNERVARALVSASGQSFATLTEAKAWLQSQPIDIAHTYGGHSPCVQVDLGTDDYILCDAGSGLRPFGQRVLIERKGAKATYHLLMSHVHWDHIMGFPFFTPSYIPGNRIIIYGCNSRLEEAFRRQQTAPSFPVEFANLGANIEFVTLQCGQSFQIGEARITTERQLHSGDSFAYRIEHGNKSFIYSTDAEHKMEDAQETERFARFFQNADVVVFDAMYSLADAMSVKEDWGHSSNVVGVELCQLADVKHLVLFHHEPIFSDTHISKVLEETRRLELITREDRSPLVISAAFDGMEIRL